MTNSKRNTYAYTKTGRRRPGVFCNMIQTLETKEDPAKQDRENRREVAKRIMDMVESGMEQEKAIEIIANQEDVKVKFGYLIKHGIDIKPTLRGIYLATKDESKAYYAHKDERWE